MELASLLAPILSPMVLAFLLGIVATLLRSDLRFPEPIYLFLTIYLLAAIGLKGGYKLSITSFTDFAIIAVIALALSASIPIWLYYVLRKIASFNVPDSAAIAAHYGSVSVVTFTQATLFLESRGVAFEGYLPGVLALMEFPAVLVALFIARRNMRSDNPLYPAAPTSLAEVLRELLAGKSNILLLGFLCIGLVVGKSGYEQVAPFFDTPFRGLLTLFLLEAGLVTGRRLTDMRRVGPALIVFALCVPVLHAALGILLARAVGLSMGGALVFGTLAASASYIAAPAAIRVALPDANPTYYLTASLAITFPFNILIGIPLYFALAQYLYS